MSRERWLRKCGATGLALFITLAALSANAAEPEHYRVRATIHRGDRTVDGEMWVRVRVGEGEDHVALWLYPDRLAVAPSAMQERSWRWIYPGEVDLGGITLDRVTIDGAPVSPPELRSRPPGSPRGRDVAGADVLVPIAPGPARTVELALRFTLRVPGRFGRLGDDDGLLALAAPWYPLVVDRDAWDFDVPQHVELRCDDGELLLDGEAIGHAGAADVRAPYVPAIAAPHFYEQVREVRGVELVLRTPSRLYVPPPPERHGPEGLIDLAEVDVGGLVQGVAEEVITTARTLGVEVPPRIVLWQIPSRTELAGTAPGVVLVSDRIFQIFPIDQTLEYHRRALRRAMFRHLAEPIAARADAPADRGWGADLRAVVMVDLDEARRHSRTETPQQLLQLFAFHPAIDQLLYAPQIAFEDAYFATIEERDPFRDDPVRSRKPLSSGRRILESARDALAPEAFQRFVAMVLHGDRSARAALREAAPERADRLSSWLRATGEPLNYRLGAIESRRLDDGRYEHRVEVLRDGAQRAEPVEVEVHDGAGNVVRGVWDAPGPRGVVTVITPAAFSGAIIDPRQRLPESPDLSEGHPRIDDTTESSWRPPILNAFLLDLFVSEALFTGLVDFALRRRYDLEHTIGIRAERTPALTGGSVRYAQGLGPKVHTNRRMGLLSGGFTFERLHEFFGGGNLGGWRGQLYVSGGINTVSYQLDPREGVWLNGTLVGGVAVRDDGSVGGTFRGAVRGGAVFPIGLVNAFAIVAGGGFTVGDALPSELQGIGGRAVLRGFESGELLGRGALYAVAEHRWTAFRDLAWNIAHLVWVRELQLVAWTGAGVVFDTPDGQPFAGGVEVGGGVRVHYEYGGVQPGVIAIDVGVPLTRQDSRVFQDGMLVRTRAPVGFYISFDQYF